MRGQCEQLFGLSAVCSEGLFTDDRVSVLKAKLSQLIVVGVGRGDVNQAGVGVGGKLLIGTIGLLKAVFSGKSRCFACSTGSYRIGFGLRQCI